MVWTQEGAINATNRSPPFAVHGEHKTDLDIVVQILIEQLPTEGMAPHSFGTYTYYYYRSTSIEGGALGLLLHPFVGCGERLPLVSAPLRPTIAL